MTTWRSYRDLILAFCLTGSERWHRRGVCDFHIFIFVLRLIFHIYVQLSRQNRNIKQKKQKKRCPPDEPVRSPLNLSVGVESERRTGENTRPRVGAMVTAKRFQQAARRRETKASSHRTRRLTSPVFCTFLFIYVQHFEVSLVKSNSSADKMEGGCVWGGGGPGRRHVLSFMMTVARMRKNVFQPSVTAKPRHTIIWDRPQPVGDIGRLA